MQVAEEVVVDFLLLLEAAMAGLAAVVTAAKRLVEGATVAEVMRFQELAVVAVVAQEIHGLAVLAVKELLE
jgi:hypothetical protein